MSTLPKIISAVPLSGKRVQVVFDNGTIKLYDCTRLMQRPAFSLLREEAFFKGVGVDAGGYGISWNDAIDISEYELWANGVEIDSVLFKQSTT